MLAAYGMNEQANGCVCWMALVCRQFNAVDAVGWCGMVGLVEMLDGDFERVTA